MGLRTGAKKWGSEPEAERFRFLPRHTSGVESVAAACGPRGAAHYIGHPHSRESETEKGIYVEHPALIPPMCCGANVNSPLNLRCWKRVNKHDPFRGSIGDFEIMEHG